MLDLQLAVESSLRLMTLATDAEVDKIAKWFAQLGSSGTNSSSSLSRLDLSSNAYACAADLARLSIGDGAAARVVAAVLAGARSSRIAEQARAIQLSLVWTGPLVAGSTMRSTQAAYLEIIESATQELLLVEYALSSVGPGGLALDAARASVARGVSVTIVVEDDAANRAALATLRLPTVRLLTWHPEGSMTKLHAKACIADSMSALVGSANLTMHGLSRNIELGVYLRGEPVRSIRRQFIELERAGLLVPWKF